MDAAASADLNEPGPAVAAPSGGWGPRSWMNSRLRVENQVLYGTEEFGIYTDADVVGHCDATTPYQFLNALTFTPGATELALPKAYLRVSDYSGSLDRPIDWSKTSTDSWTGATPSQEVAALGSLIIGKRLESGGQVRRTEPGDPMGNPYYVMHRIPRIEPPQDVTRAMLPSAIGTADLRLLAPLSTSLEVLSAAEARLILRCALQYQAALRYVETDPELAWIKLVGAAEVLAQREPDPDRSARELLAEWWPEMLEALQGVDETTLDAVARLALPLSRSTSKFVRFLTTRLPPAPAVRQEPPELDWSPEGLTGPLKQVYKNRSRSLHAGEPIPAALCMPFAMDGEKPPAVSYGGDNWAERDLPMTIAVFERIVRHAALRWWADRSGDDQLLAAVD